MARRSDLLAEAERLAAFPPPSVPETITGEVLPAEDVTFDEEDFYEALDLMETSLKILKRLNEKRHSKYIANHCDDLEQFLDEFIDMGGAE